MEDVSEEHHKSNDYGVGKAGWESFQQDIRHEFALDQILVRDLRQEKRRYSDSEHTDQRDVGRLQRIGYPQEDRGH